MNIPIELPQLFKPQQPLVLTNTKNVAYQEYSPDIRLQPYIASYWESWTECPLQEVFSLKVVTDSCVHLVIVPNRPELNFLRGFSDAYFEFPVGKSFHFYGVSFYPGAFSQLFNIGVNELSKYPTSLDTILPKISQLIESRIEPGQDTHTIINFLDELFLKLLASVKRPADARFYNALYTIYKNKGIFNPEKELDLGITPRHLRRLFNYHVGESPKTLSQVIRFQSIINAKPSLGFIKESKIFYDLGYYDQSHFIKEIKKFSGKTPSSFFSSMENPLE